MSTNAGHQAAETIEHIYVLQNEFDEGYSCSMQPLPRATNEASAGSCARELVEVSIPLNWYIRRKLRAHRRGLSVPQFRALVLVANQPRTSLSALSDHLEVSLPNASRIVSGLVEKRLLGRAGNASDRRQMSLEITAKGRDMLESAWSATQSQVAEELAPLTLDQRRSLLAVLALMKSMFGSLSLPRVPSEPAVSPSVTSKSVAAAV